MLQLGLTNGALLKIEKGDAQAAGKYEIQINLARILQEEETQALTEKRKEEKLFAKKQLGKLVVEHSISVADLKKKIFALFL